MLIQTDSLDSAKLKSLDEPTTHQLYCGLDCCLTLEVFEELSALCTPAGSSEPDWPVCYNFERALQAPALDMMLRGFKIDQFERHKAIRQLRGDTVKGKGVSPEGEIGKFQSQLDELATAVWDKGLNVASPKQMKAFFYGALRLPEVVISEKGEKRVSTNREALEKLDQYFHARPLVALVFAIRDLQGVLRQLESEIDPDGRFRMSINIGGTETGRFSTSKSVTGTGGNGQNLKRDDDLEEGELSIRRCFVADRGWKLCNIDLEQTESRDVGFLQGSILGDWRYLDACEQNDLHTAVAKMVWPQLGWTGEPKADRKLADQNFYRHFSYRDMAKRGGHLTNYMGTAWTAARSLKVPQQLMDDFQTAYVAAFPAFPAWWQWIAQQIQLNAELTTPYGRRRMFFGRRDDDSTLREAIAFVPQSMTADRMNLGLWRVWKQMPEVQLLAQVHDSICFQFRDPENSEREAEIVQRALKLIEEPLVAPNGRVVLVGGEAKVGWNWGAFGPANPEGLTKWSSTLPDTRKRRQDMERTL